MSERAPVLALQGIRRRFVQGQAALDVLQGIDLVAAAPARSPRWSARRAPASRRCCTSPACSSGPAPARSTIEGRACSGLGDAERTRLRRERIGFVYQFHHLLPDFTALENVAMPQLIAGRGRRARPRRGPRALLERLGLAARLDHRPARLSGGEQQRVAIARALANAPGADPGRRADRQSRPADGRGGVRDPARGRARHGHGGPDRHPQPRAGRADGRDLPPDRRARGPAAAGRLRHRVATGATCDALHRRS